MKTETADALCQALDSLSAEYERRENYKGINNPKPTTAIVLGDVQSLLVAVATAAASLSEEAVVAKNYLVLLPFIKDVGRLSIDQASACGTGSDIVVY